jgi:hypothetical protein
LTQILGQSCEFKVSGASKLAESAGNAAASDAASAAVADAEAATELRPGWGRGYYRHGLALWSVHHKALGGASSAEARSGLAAAYGAVDPGLGRIVALYHRSSTSYRNR